MVPPVFAAELDGVDYDDPVALGSDQFFGAELAKDTYHDLTNRADRMLKRTIPSNDWIDEIAALHATGNWTIQFAGAAQ